MTMTIIPIPGTGSCVGGDCVAPAQRIVATSGPIATSDNIILVQHAGVVNLALPTGAGSDQWFIVKDFDGNAGSFQININTGGGDQIELADGSGLGTTYTLDVDFQSVLILCDGAGRYFIA